MDKDADGRLTEDEVREVKLFTKEVLIVSNVDFCIYMQKNFTFTIFVCKFYSDKIC